MKKKIAIVFGTRPEAIKMAPVIRESIKNNDFFETIVIVTAQHREMLDQVLSVFKITPDYDLNIMRENQSLSEITSDVLKGMEQVYLKEKPDMVLVHGDTTTSLSAALAAYYQHIPIAHIEAGLRTYDKKNPFPEEANRQLIDSIADLFFVPTNLTKNNLLLEQKNKDNIVVTGNTVIDSIKLTKSLTSEHFILNKMESTKNQKWIILTMHRRENHGQPMINVFKAIINLVEKYDNVEILIPVHLSPNVKALTEEFLCAHERIHLVEPLEVDVFHRVMEKATLVLTDSGGLQEEAPSLNIPVLVLRDKTERPEGVEAGTLRVIGTNSEKVYSTVSELLDDKEEYIRMSSAKNPYGDGTASKKIISFIKQYFS